MSSPTGRWLGRAKLAFPYLLLLAALLGVFCSNLGSDPGRDQATRAEPALPTLVDPVCGMEVNPAWGHSQDHAGRSYYFCSESCKLKFASNPDQYLQESCPVCGEPVSPSRAFPATYLGKTYELCSQEHRRLFKADPAGYFMHTMWGIPDWLYYLSIGIVLLISFLVLEIPGERAGAGARPRLDLMASRPMRILAGSRVFRFLLQLSVVLLFLLVIAAGLYGVQNPAMNIAPLLTWTVWWGGLVVVIMFLGKAWCYVCPWDAIAGWVEGMSLWRKPRRGIGLALPWPRSWRNIRLATILFVGLTWVELGFGVTMSPAATAWLALAMLLLALGSVLLFDRRSFCRYGCLVGRVSGLYAMFSAIEVRSRDKAACRACRSKECVKGSATAHGCPTFQYPGGMQTNTYCIQCMECVQACPHDNIAVNLRPWGSDLAVGGKPASDEAFLALLMLSITAFHGLTMTPAWRDLLAVLEAPAWSGQVLSFSLGMVAIMLAPIALFTLLVRMSHMLALRSGGARGPGFGGYFVRYAYCVLPIALFYHLAHNLEHLLMEGPKVVALISDPLGRGWNLMGTAGLSIPPMVSLDTLWILQVVLVAVGHVYSLWAAREISRRSFGDHALARRSQWPILLGMIAFSIFSLWLLKQPMEMRSSAM